MIFECVVEADLAKETILYSGSSAARAIEFRAAAVNLAHLFQLDAVIKITRYKRVGSTIFLLSKTVFRNGLSSSHKERPTADWHRELSILEASL